MKRWEIAQLVLKVYIVSLYTYFLLGCKALQIGPTITLFAMVNICCYGDAKLIKEPYNYDMIVLGTIMEL